MNDYNAIEVTDVYKKFKNYQDKSHSLKERIIQRERNKSQEFWVLKGISFQVKKGEAVGLIGCNGCGKSTTLKLLTKIIYPDRGKINITGRVSSLLELGAGFHPDLSGYENIYLNASVFGLTRKEIDNRVDEIIRFSELKEFIDNPIRTYSSGMYMKLAFSVAINVDADILLIDEILGVGDVNFQKKCFDKLLSIKKSGITIVIVSHSTDQIEKICDKSIWIDNGVVREMGDTKCVNQKYLNVMNAKRIIQMEKEELDRKEARKKIETKEELEILKVRNKKKRALLEVKAEAERKRQQEYIAQVEDEKQKQLIAQQEAERKRKEQELIQKEFETSNYQENELYFEYYKKETKRLEYVVEEKDIEIGRLNSVIREKQADILRIEAVLAEKESQLEKLGMEKDEEIQQLEFFINERGIF